MAQGAPLPAEPPASAVEHAAGEVGLQLTWEAPADCPATSDVTARIDALRAGADGTGRPLRASAVVDHLGGGWRLRLELVSPDATSERVVEGATCEELADAAALLVVLATDATDAPSARSVRPPAPSSRAGSAPTPRPPRPRPPPTTTPAESATIAPSLRAAGVADVASLGAPALGVGATAALRVGPVRPELGVTWLPPRTITRPGEDAGAEVSLLFAVARACWVPWRGDVELAACLGFEAGSLQAEGFGVTTPGSGTSPWLAPQAAVLGHLTLVPGLAGVLGVEAAVPLAKERFVLLGVGDVHGAPDLTARAILGLELRP